MKKLALAAAISVAATSAFAGNLKKPVMEAPVAVQTATKKTSSSSPIVLPLILLAVVVAAVASK